VTWQQAEPTVRLAAFLGVFTLVAVAERLAPRRPSTRPVGWRWLNNLGIVGVDRAVLAVLGRFLPLATVGLAAATHDAHGGLFGLLGLRGAPAVVVGFVLLDLAIWAQHLVFHRVPVLWRLHRVHHADVDYDVTLGLRFHPLEIVLSIGIKLAVIAALGVPPLAVLVFEVVLNAAAMFNHGNVRLPGGVDRVLRTVLVTPDMHRVHHSSDPAETHRNFGFNLPWWDHLFGTYTAAPRLGQEGFEIGLPTFRAPREAALDRMLTQPFRGT
jgi:sterol desaturase/sphingolipid hydroxylase (fatty acid hydroxylase superfamily)